MAEGSSNSGPESTIAVCGANVYPCGLKIGLRRRRRKEMRHNGVLREAVADPARRERGW